MLEQLGGMVATVGLAGFAGIWLVKAAFGVVLLRWFRNWNIKRKGTG